MDRIDKSPPRFADMEFTDASPTRGRYTFWELHRMLADCYETDVATSSVAPGRISWTERSNSIHRGRKGRSQSVKREARRPSLEVTVVHPPKPPPTQELPPAPPLDPILCQSVTPDSSSEKPANVAHRSFVQTLRDLHGLGSGDNDVDVASLQLHCHDCWQTRLEKKVITTMRSQFISADASYQSSAQSHIVAVDTDTDTQPQKAWVCMLHPSGGLRTSWNLLVALCVLYDLLVIPLAVFDLPESSLSQALDIGIQAFWNLDFGLAFLTGFYDQGSLVMDRVAVARQYAKTWMVFDLFLILMDWSVTVMDHVTLTGNPADWSRTIRMLRLLRLVRIVRAIKLRRGFVAVQDLLHSQAASLYLSFYVSLGQLLVLNHWMACAWFGVSWLNTDNWVVASGLQDQNAQRQYLACILWSFCQLGVGESPLQPTNEVEMLLNVCITFRSLITSATLISTMSSLIAGLRKIEQDETTEFRLLRRYLKHNEIRSEVTQFLQHQYALKQQARSFHARVPLLDLLSRPLFHELQFERYRLSLCKLRLIRDLLDEPGMQTLHTLYELASTSLHHTVAASGDVIFLSGKAAASAYLKLSGSLCYYHDEGDDVLDDSRWVAEMCLWAPWVYMGDLESMSMSELLALDADAFCATLSQNWDTQQAASMYAKRFLAAMHKQKMLTDIFVDYDHDLDSEESEVEQPLVDLSLLPFLPASWKRFCLQFLRRKRPSTRQIAPEGRGRAVKGRVGP
ncbi:Cnga4 [Symbiodinium sp. CCMP2456]|nr:Cnga4 [Symbiodinium sp. CCMP2456]